MRASRRSSSGVTIQAVAERAGVSAMSVSNVLNGRKKVQESTRKAVLQAVEELDYRPNLAARALASATPARIGLLYRNPQSAWLSALLVGAVHAAAKFGAQLLIERSETETVEHAEAALEALARSGANAVLVPAPFCDLLGSSTIGGRLKLPLVGLSPGEELPNMPSVRIDDYQAARDMTARLVAQGHRRIGFVCGPATHSASKARFEGYKAALQEAGIAWDPGLVQPGEFSFESGLVAAAKLLDLVPIPTAIFASNDDMAAAVVSTAHRRGIHVPGAVAVTGFDDTPIATKIWPPLTSVRQPVSHLAELATERLIQLVQSPEGTADDLRTSIIVPHEIVERESTNAAPVSAETTFPLAAGTELSSAKP